MWLSIAVSMLAIYLATNEGRWQVARKTGEAFWFSTGLFTRLVYIAGVLAYPAIAALPSNGRVTTVGLLLLPALLVITWPRTIVLDGRGVTELLWGGLRRRRAEWPDVMHAIRMETDEELEVHLILNQCKPIKHTKLHVDRSGFIREVSKHAEVFGGPPRVL